MKKLLTLAIVAAGILTITPSAEAHGDRVRVVRYYDSCGYPVYGYVTRRSYRPAYYTPSSYRGRDYRYDRYDRGYRRGYTRGGISISFGR